MFTMTGVKLELIQTNLQQALLLGNGRVEIGRRVLTSNARYASTYVDEIKMYNRQLSESEIQNMY